MPDPECPPPGGGGFKPRYPNQPIQIGTTGTFRFYGFPQRDCGAIVTWVHPQAPGEHGQPLVNLTAFLNHESGSAGTLHMRKIGPWPEDD